MSCVAAVSAQQISTRGTEFLLTFLENSDRQTLSVFMSAQQRSDVTLSIGGTVLARVTVAANGSQRVDIEDPRAYQDESDVVCDNCAIRVSATTPISVYAFNTTDQSTDAAVVLPLAALGNRYIVASYRHYDVDYPRDWSSLFAIVGVQNNSVVEITPTADIFSPAVGRRRKGVPFEVRLDEGDAIQFKTITSPADLTGSLVRVVSSTNDCPRVAVFTGHQRTSVPSVTRLFRDHLYEHLPPVSTLGKSYIVPPLSGSSNYTIRVIASEPNTDVVIDGVTSNLVNATSWLERAELNGALHHTITATKPVMVVLYALSSERGWSLGGDLGDPFMVIVPPIQQKIDQATIYAFVPNNVRGWGDNLYVTIVTDASQLSTVTFDGYPLSAIPSTTARVLANVNVGGGQRCVSFRVREGVHTIDAEKNGGMIAIIHGLAEADSYGFVAGASYVNLRTKILTATVPVCPGSPVQFSGFNSDSLNITSWKWIFHDGKSADGKNTSRTYAEPGTYEVKLVMQRTDCGADTAYATVRIASGFVASARAEDSVICVNEEVELRATTAPVARYRYEWRPLGIDGRVSGTNDSVLRVRHSTVGRYQYVVTAQDDAGCAATDTVELQVVPPPSITLESRVTVCQGEVAIVQCSIRDTRTTTIRWSAATREDSSLVQTWSTTNSLEARGDVLGDHSYTVTATNTEGCISQQTVIVAVLPGPRIRRDSTQVIVSCIGVGTDPIDLGKGVVIEGGTAPYQVLWEEQGGGTSSFVGARTSLITQVRPTRTTTYVLIVRDATPGASCSSRLEITVELRPTPDANAGLDAVLCACDVSSQTILGDDARCGTAPYTYRWEPTTGLVGVSATSAVVTARPAATTTYVLTVTDAMGRSNRDSVTVRVEPCPDVRIANVASQCESDTVYVINAVVAGDTAGYRYAWQPANYLDDPNVRSPTLRLPKATSSYTYRLTVTSPFGCTASDDVQLQHSAGLKVSIEAIKSCLTGVICRGETVRLRARVVGGRSAYAYSWRASSSYTPNWSASTEEVLVQPLSNTTFVVSVTDALGCVATDSVAICIDPVPNVRMGNDTSICFSDRSTARILRGEPSTCGKRPFVYVWSPAAKIQIPDASRPYEALLRVDTTTVFTLAVTDDGGAGNTTVDTVTVAVQPPLRIEGISDTVKHCLGTEAPLLRVQCRNGDGPYSVSVLKGTSTIAKQQTASDIEVALDSVVATQGTFPVIVRVVDSRGCMIEDTSVIVVNAPPLVEITYGLEPCICDTVTLSARVQPGSAGASGLVYKWSEVSEDAPPGTTTLRTDSASSQRIRVRYSTRYTVTVTDANGCMATQTVRMNVRRAGSGTFVGMDTTKADPRKSDVPLAVRLHVQGDTALCLPRDVQFAVTYRMSLYDPSPSITPGVVLSNDVVDVAGEYWRTVVARVPVTAGVAWDSTLATFHGKALVGAPGHTAMKVHDVKFLYECDTVLVAGVDGALVLDSLCITDDSVRRLLSFESLRVLSVYPNPVVQEAFAVRVGITRSTPIRSIITDVTGRRVAMQEHGLNAKGEHLLRINAPRVPGLYSVHLESDIGTSIVPITVVGESSR